MQSTQTSSPAAPVRILPGVIALILMALPASGQTIDDYSEFHRLLRIDAAEHVVLCHEIEDPMAESRAYGVMRDTSGRPTQMTIFMFGNPDSRTDWTTMRIRYIQLDTINSIIERRTFYNASGMPVDLASGIFMEEILRRIDGPVVLRKFLNRSGELVNDTAGVSRTLFRETAGGELMQEWFYGTGKQHYGTGSDGPARPFAPMSPQTYFRVIKLDHTGNLLSERLLDFDRKPLPFPGGEVIRVYEPDDCGQPVRVTFLDAEGRPMTDADGVAFMRFGYDYAGRMVEWSTFGPGGKPHGRGAERVAAMRYTYRRFDGLLVGIEKFDEKGNPVQ